MYASTSTNVWRGAVSIPCAADYCTFIENISRWPSRDTMRSFGRRWCPRKGRLARYDAEKGAAPLARMSLQTCLELVRQRGAALPEQVAVHLLCASVWRASVAGISLRPGRVLLDASEGLILDALHPAGAGSDSGYLAPDAVAGEAA